MTIFIYTFDKMTFEVDVSANDTVSQLRRAITNITGVSAEDIRLFYTGKSLGNSYDNSKLSEYGIKDGGTVRAFMKLGQITQLNQSKLILDSAKASDELEHNH